MSTFDIVDETFTINLITTDEALDRNAAAIATETQRAEQAETTLQSHITTETERAEAQDPGNCVGGGRPAGCRSLVEDPLPDRCGG